MNQPKYARVISVKAKKGKGRLFARAFEEGIASTAGKIAGLQDLYLFSPVGKPDKLLILSLWDEETSAKNYLKSGQDVKYAAKLSKLQKGEERVKPHRVLLRTLGGTV
jgi:heme-degrading monooxygenase HmoA